MKKVIDEILVDMILEDVLSDGHLFEMNPYHDAEGHFTSKGATDLYQSGALAFGRAKGMKAKAQGLGQEAIRAAIKGGIEKHLAGNGERDAGQKRLDLVRGMTKRGTLGPAPAPKAPRAPREPGIPKEKQGENMQTFMGIVKKQHAAALAKADDAVRRINAKEGDQIKARKDWNDAHKEMGELRGKLEAVQKKIKGKSKPAHEDKPKAHASERDDPKPDHKAMTDGALHKKLADLQQQHADAAEEHRAAQAGVRERATHSGAGRLYRTMAQANDTMAALKGQMAQVEKELKKRGKA